MQRPFFVVVLSLAFIIQSSGGAVDAAAVVGPSWVPADWPRVSVVVVDALWLLLGDAPRPPSYANTSLTDACTTEGFTFVRVAGTAFWPNSLSRYLTNRDAYLAAVDQLYSVGQAAGCKILLSLFWNWFAGADLMHEPLGEAFRNEGSLTRQFWKNYTADVIGIAAKYPKAVAGWELGNELNLLADLNLTGTHNCHPSLGTPPRRTTADNFSTTDMVNFEIWLAGIVRNEATAHSLPTLVSTGHSIPRTDAWHLRQSYHDPSRDWTADSKEEFVQIFWKPARAASFAPPTTTPGTAIDGDPPIPTAPIRWSSRTTPSITQPIKRYTSGSSVTLCRPRIAIGRSAHR